MVSVKERGFKGEFIITTHSPPGPLSLSEKEGGNIHPRARKKVPSIACKRGDSGVSSFAGI
jgi:hypothetical protein